MGNVFVPRSQDARYIEEESEFYIVEEYTGVNYIRNGGFELGYDFWTTNFLVYLTEGKFGGKAANVKSAGTISQVFESATLNGTTTSFAPMYVSFDAKGVGTSPSVNFNMNTGAGVNIRSESVAPRVGEWTRYTYVFTPTSITSQIAFTHVGGTSVMIDNISITSSPIDFHIPMPQALTMRPFDLSDQKAPYLSARGVSIILHPLSDYGFVMSAVVGLGYEDPSNNVLQLPSGESKLMSTVPTGNEFSITGTISDASSANVDRKKAALIQALSKNLDRPIVLAHKRRNCRLDIGNLGFISCVYTGGLGIQRTNNHIQDVSLDFSTTDSKIYYAPKTLTLANTDALRSTTAPTTATATFPRHRWFFRYKDQPYRSVRVSDTSTVYSSLNGGALEDREGNLWIWGRAADQIALDNGGTPSATNRYVARLYKNSAKATVYAFTHATSAEVYGLTLLQNGDIVAYGMFTGPTTGAAVWSSRTATWGAFYTSAITSTNANFAITKMIRVGNRMWWLCNANCTVNGVSLGTDSQCARSVFYTDNYFRAGNRYEIEPTNTPVMYLEADNSGNVFLASITAPSDDVCRVYRMIPLNDGSVNFRVMAALDESSSHVAESYIVGRMVRRNAGVLISYSYWPAGFSGAGTPYIMEITDIQNKKVQQAPASSFYENQMFTDEAGNTITFTTTDSTGSAGSTTNYKYKNLDLSGAVEFTAGGKYVVATERWMYKSKNWTFGKEPFVNYYRAIPSQSIVTSPAAVRTSPIVRFIGGGYATLLGRIYNETNGSSLSFSGRLQGGEEFIFDPENPQLPEGLTLIENTGPGGVFSLEAGANSILVHSNTLWHTIPGGAVSGSGITRHLELRGLESTPFFTGKVNLRVTSSVFYVDAYVGGLTLAMCSGSTTPTSTEPSGTLSVLTLSDISFSGVDGLALLYSGTYTGYSSGALYVPYVDLIMPTTSLTIEAGTV